MTAAVLDRPVCRASLLDGGRTLEELLSATLDQARTNGSTECPVCHARMTSTRHHSTRAREVTGGGEALAAECGGCGSRLR